MNEIESALKEFVTEHFAVDAVRMQIQLRTVACNTAVPVHRFSDPRRIRSQDLCQTFQNLHFCLENALLGA